MENTLLAAGDVAQEIKQIIVEGLQVNVRVDDIPDNYSLLEDGLALDSILISELIVLIEKRYGIQFDDRALDVELFDNLANLSAFVVARLSQTAGSAETVRSADPVTSTEEQHHPGELPC